MRWRLLRLNWAYGVGELVIVVAGVMIALGFEQWNSDRLDRVEEVEIIGRFIADLQSDFDVISGGLNIVSRKEASLDRVYSSLETPVNRPTELLEFLYDVASGASFGWDQGSARRTTFDEVLASGKFGLIRDTAIRVQISDYYEGDLRRTARIDERETGYADLSYSLVPRVDGGNTALPELSDAQQARLVDQVFSSLEPSQVAAELNFARYVNAGFTGWKATCLDLIDELETYREALGHE